MQTSEVHISQLSLHSPHRSFELDISGLCGNQSRLLADAARSAQAVVPQARDREGRRVVTHCHVQTPSEDGPDTAWHLKATPSRATGPVAAAAATVSESRRRDVAAFRARWRPGGAVGVTGQVLHSYKQSRTHSSPTNSAVRPISTHGHTAPSRHIRLSRAQSYSPRSSGEAGLFSAASHASPMAFSDGDPCHAIARSRSAPLMASSTIYSVACALTAPLPSSAAHIGSMTAPTQTCGTSDPRPLETHAPRLTRNS